MTDKQIIIDGVDVSGCRYYDDRYGYCEACKDDIDGASFTKCMYEDNCYYKQLKRKEQELIDYKKQFKADTKEMEDYQNEITRHLESIEFWQHQAEAKEQECEELKERLNCNCFDPKNNNNRCISYNRIAEDYERDLRQLDQLKEQLEAYKMEADEGKEINAELKAENDKLKEELNKKYIREDIKTYCPFFFRDTATCLGRDLNEIGQLKFCNKYHNCWIKKVSRENLKLKQTLTEIKEIAENVIKNVSDRCIETTPMYYIHKQILQKISEVENETINN